MKKKVALVRHIVRVKKQMALLARGRKCILIYYWYNGKLVGKLAITTKILRRHILGYN